jgi:hypothetical protein
MMIFLLDNLPPNLHIVIASRTDPLVRMASLRAKGHLCELCTTDLRFSLVEAAHEFGHYLSHLAYGNEGVQVHPDPLGGSKIVGVTSFQTKAMGGVANHRCSG